MTQASPPFADPPDAPPITHPRRATGQTRWDEVERGLELPLQRGGCHIWSLSLLQSEDRLAILEQILSREERRRAEAFLLPSPRRQFVTCRGALRVLLGAYLECEPSDCRFAVTEFGKPWLEEPASDLRFNLSHSGNRALIAISRDLDVGIDIEIHRTFDDISGIARMILCDEDLERWSVLPPTDRVHAFYRAWTRKEAVSKAIGCGLAMDFPSLRVGFVAGQPTAVLEMDPTRGRAHDWTLKSIAVGDDYSAAIAAATRRLELVQYTLGP